MITPILPVIDPSLQAFMQPVKRIHDGPDVQFFLSSLAYRDIMTFMLQLDRSMVPEKQENGITNIYLLNTIDLKSLPPSIKAIRQVLESADTMIAEAPPDPGPRRFGNISFRKWHSLLSDRAESLLNDVLPDQLHPAIVELTPYLLGSFGSPQRLDYGTGHELSFLAFLAILWKLKFFVSVSAADTPEDSPATTQVSSQIVLAIFEPYLILVRKLIQHYNLEPAGSHGVWGLDDNSFLPYIFGSAQYCPPISKYSTPPTPTPTTGSLDTAPPPGTVTNQKLTSDLSSSNMYFSAIHFIHTIKRGPFWEHSPMLFDISGIKEGWGKINKGMIKMWSVEVLGKFPVVQHFVFGSILKWEHDPRTNAPEMGSNVQSVHLTSQPLRDPSVTSQGQVCTAAPWAKPGSSITSTNAPTNGGMMAPAGPRRTPNAPLGFVNGVTQAPWARGGGGSPSLPRGGFGTGTTRRPPPPALSKQNTPQEADKDLVQQ